MRGSRPLVRALGALIGHGGFVGGDLERQWQFAVKFNSRTNDGAAGHLDRRLRAGTGGSMVEAERGR